MTEDEPLPLTRMVSIKNPVFWIFLAVCVALYTYDKFIRIDRAAAIRTHSLYRDGILIAAFIALFLTILAELAKNPSNKRTINICCYVFEAASVITLGMLIFFG